MNPKLDMPIGITVSSYIEILPFVAVTSDLREEVVIPPAVKVVGTLERISENLALIYVEGPVLLGEVEIKVGVPYRDGQLCTVLPSQLERYDSDVKKR